MAEKAIDAIRHPESAARKAVEGLEAVSAVLSQFADPAPDVPLNQEIGPHRRYVWARSELATFKRIKDTLGGTVNDVVLAVVTGSIRNWLHSRGVRTEGLELRALVPVSIRAEDEHGDLGNRIALMRGPLPVYIEDPVRRLHAISEEMAGLKESKQALGAEMISRFNDFAPPTLLAQASRINFSTRLFNLLVTNVPGPQIPLYVLGRELEEVFPVAFLPQNHALAVAIMSYHGKIGFGLLADYDSMEDIELLGRRDQRLAGRARGGRRPGRRRGAEAPTRRPRARGYPLQMGLLLVLALHRRPDRRALRDHPGRRADRRLADALLLLLDAIVGSWLLKHEGRAAWRRFNQALAEKRRFPAGRSPTASSSSSAAPS